MSNLIFNVGLENNPYNAYATGMLLRSFGDIKRSAIVMGEYEGNAERTLVAEIECQETLEHVFNWVRVLAKITTQDCIAFNYDGLGYVLGQLESGENDIEFDAQYFKTL